METQKELYLAITKPYSENSVSRWKLGGAVGIDEIVLLEYNLTFMCLDIYLSDGRSIKVFDVKELFYRPKDAKEENLSNHERAVTESEAVIYN